LAAAVGGGEEKSGVAPPVPVSGSALGAAVEPVVVP
jgi:hypothetical protein